MKKILKFIGVFLLVIFSFVLGNKNNMSAKVYINGQEVEVVDFMYTYKNEYVI